MSNERTPTSDADDALWRHLRDGQVDGHQFERRQAIGPFVAPFICREAELIVEVEDGPPDEPAEKDKDIRRTFFLNTSGYRVLRFSPDEVLQNIEGVVSAIAAALREDKA